MIVAFLDASVLIAATLSATGASRLIVNLTKARRIKSLVSPIIVREVVRNLQNKYAQEKLVEFLKLLTSARIEIVDFDSVDEIEVFRNITASKDMHVLAGAKKSGAAYLVSLDKRHILKLSVKKLPFKICSPKEFLEVLRTGKVT